MTQDINSDNTSQPQDEVPATLAKAAAGLESAVAARRQAAEAAATRNNGERERTSAARHRRTNLGGAQLKLEVGVASLPGYHLYWENDVDARLERLLSNGFEFVTPAEAGMQQVTTRVVVDSDVDNRVSKFVGTTDDSKPMRAYLMKCPLDLWEDIQHCINDLADSRDRDIRDSASQAKGDRYQPKGYETKVTSGTR